MNSVFVVSSQNPDDVKSECTLSEPNDKENLNPQNDWNSASLTVSPAYFGDKHNDQKD